MILVLSCRVRSFNDQKIHKAFQKTSELEGYQLLKNLYVPFFPVMYPVKISQITSKKAPLFDTDL
jgi:hypothetical protein